MWDLVTGAQRFQFSSPVDRPTCVAYAPPTPGGERLQSAAGDGGGDDAATPKAGGGVVAGAAGCEERHLLAGYVSGAVRVFDVPSASTVLELEQHRGAVQQVRTAVSVYVCMYSYVLGWVSVCIDARFESRCILCTRFATD